MGAADELDRAIERNRPRFKKFIKEMESIMMPPGYKEWVTENAARKAIGEPLITWPEWCDVFSKDHPTKHRKG